MATIFRRGVIHLFHFEFSQFKLLFSFSLQYFRADKFIFQELLTRSLHNSENVAIQGPSKTERLFCDNPAAVAGNPSLESTAPPLFPQSRQPRPAAAKSGGPSRQSDPGPFFRFPLFSFVLASKTDESRAQSGCL